MKFELKAFRDDKAQPLVVEEVNDINDALTQSNKIAAKHHLGAFLFPSLGHSANLYENGIIYVSPITEG